MRTANFVRCLDELRNPRTPNAALQLLALQASSSRAYPLFDPLLLL